MPAARMSSDDVRTRFESDTAEHEMTVLRDDGLYRHIRFQRPGSSAYYYDLVTWPGRLAITGDAGDFMFSRLTDMFTFFEGQEGINPGYWAEKLIAPAPAGARKYSEALYEQLVREWADEQEPAVKQAALSQLLAGDSHYEEGAREQLREFRHEGVGIGDYWEWDLRDFTYHFLWCCWAIRTGIARYRAEVAAEPAPAA